MREDLIERLRSVKWDVISDGDRMPDDPTRECVFVDMRPAEFEALLTEAAAALEAAREDGWQPIETAPKPDIGANGFGKRLLLVVDCGEGTIPSVRRGYWAGTDWYLDCCNGLATACGYRVTHWRPLPEPPAIDQARGEGAGRWKVGEVKPCEVPCPKCGHDDIHRVFRAKGSDWRCEVYGRAENKYACADTYIARAWRDHIDNTCRCCRYRWQTLPLRKRRPTQQQETPR